MRSCVLNAILCTKVSKYLSKITTAHLRQAISPRFTYAKLCTLLMICLQGMLFARGMLLALPRRSVNSAVILERQRHGGRVRTVACALTGACVLVGACSLTVTFSYESALAGRARMECTAGSLCTEGSLCTGGSLFSHWDIFI